MRILFISPYVPSLIRVRPYHWIKRLAALGHRVTLLSLVTGDDDLAALPEMQAVCERVATAPLPRWRPLWNCLRAGFGPEPLQLAYSRLPAMARLIDQTLASAQFDIAHLEHLRAACFRPALTGLPVVYDAVDSISLLFERTWQTNPRRTSRLLARLDLDRTRRFEGQVLHQFARVLVTSPEDAQQFRRLASAEADPDRLRVLPNGVDLAYFCANGYRRLPQVLLFSGKMSYHANVAAALYLAQEILPLIWQQRPEVQLWIAGKDPVAAVRALAADQRITVTGFVPDMRPYLGQATVAVNALRYGVGIQNKVLEAMASGTPVVTTSQACQALAVEAGHHLLVADTPVEFARQVLALLDAPVWQARLAQAGRRYVETHHNWDTQAQRLVTIYEEALGEVI